MGGGYGRKYITSIIYGILAILISFLLMFKILPTYSNSIEVARLDSEVASIRRELDSRFKVLKWDLEDVVNRRWYSTTESIESIYLKLNSIQRDLEELEITIEKMRNGDISVTVK